MRTSRRSFIAGFASALAAPALVRAELLMPVKSGVPILWGDGIHDDHDALMAALNGLPVKNRAGVIIQDYWIDGVRGVYLRGGTYRISRALIFRDCSAPRHLNDMTLLFDRQVAGPLVSFEKTPDYIGRALRV